MTADEKIKESEYNLQKLKDLKMNPMSEEIKFLLSNFLNSSRSILYHLLEDFNLKYRLQIRRALDIKTFRKRAERICRKTDDRVLVENMKNALRFAEWYKQELRNIKKDEGYGFMTELRNINVHRRGVQPSRRIGMKGPLTFSAGQESHIDMTDVYSKGSKTAKMTIEDKATGKIEERQVDAINEWVFNENPNQDVTTVCDLFLKKLKNMVNEAQSRF